MVTNPENRATVKETMVETTRFVGVYVEKSNHFRDSEVVRNGLRPPTVSRKSKAKSICRPYLRESSKQNPFVSVT